MANGVNSVGGSVPQSPERYAKPAEDFVMDADGSALATAQPSSSEGPGPAYILNLSPEALKALDTMREKGNRVAS